MRGETGPQGEDAFSFHEIKEVVPRLEGDGPLLGFGQPYGHHFGKLDLHDFIEPLGETQGDETCAHP